MTDSLSGREPQLATNISPKRTWQLSQRGLAAMLNMMPQGVVSLDAIRAALEHEDFFVRHNAAKRLYRRADREARLTLQNALTHEDSRTRASAARFLHGFSWYAAEPLVQQALGDPDTRVREAVVYSLCDFQQLNAYQTMAQALQAEADVVRSAAVWGMRHHRDPAMVPVLAAALLAEDPDVRVETLEALGTCGLPEAIPVAQGATADADPEVVYAAALSWLELAEDACLPGLAAFIVEQRGRIRHAALRALFHAANYLKMDMTQDAALTPTLRALKAALTDELAATRLAAAYPLAWIRHPRAHALLKQAYHQEPDPVTKGEIIYLALNLLSPAGDDLLAAGLKDPDPIIRTRAQRLEQDLAEERIKRIYV